MSLIHEYIDVSPAEEVHPSQLGTVGEILDLIQRIQEETDEAGRRARGANVGIEFIKIAMGEIPLVGGALGAADGLFAMYQAGKNEEHTWAELEEYPILNRMKMHPDLAKHLDPITLREVDKAYQQYLTTLGRKTRVTDIKDIDIFARDWIKDDTGGNLNFELIREYVRTLLREAANEYGWEVASKKSMLLDKEGMEQRDKDNQEKFLKSMSLMESLLIEQKVKFSGILKIMPSPETLGIIDGLISELPPEAVVLPSDKWHVALVHQGILKPFRKELKRLDKAGMLPPPPPVHIDPQIEHRAGLAPGLDVDRQSWVVWVENQGALATYVNEVMELVGGPPNPEPTRVFHISIANLTGNPGDSVR